MIESIECNIIKIIHIFVTHTENEADTIRVRESDRDKQRESEKVTESERERVFVIEKECKRDSER